MKKKQLENFRKWFSDFVAGFYGNDEYVNNNIRLKEVHTEHVCREMSWLTSQVGIAQPDTLIADAIALFHDIGRFEQFKRYRTYVDFRSINHCILGLQVLESHNVLSALAEREKRIINTAIKLHGLKQLPAALDEETAVFAALIRDADKLDIYRVVIDAYRQYRDDPENFNLELEFDDNPYCSRRVIDAVLAQKRLSYSDLETLSDYKLLMLTWIYDVNYTVTLQRIKQRRFIQDVRELLPATDEMTKIIQVAENYIDQKIKNK